MANKILGVEGDIDEEKTKFSRKISKISLCMIVREQQSSRINGLVYVLN
ncbi:hypothetical protein OZD68_05125 [Wolbachia endosymbiont of Drosophila bicornuta]|nr:MULTISPECIES: hypothetical protein [Wolbachia]MBA8755323.1 hypothetical protein [Wolbachia pipientis]MDE5056947.1 hypothetical protein [Wolbachia endosymbiont of Drosophila bicornuta]